jgi:hypothetical protein
MKKLYFLNEDENQIQATINSVQKKTAEEEKRWSTLYSCVVNQAKKLNIQPTKYRDGSTSYLINGYTYYNNGIKAKSKTEKLKYNCQTEFVDPDQMQKNITSVFCRRNSNGRLTIPNSPLDGTLWSDYADKYGVTQTHIAVATRTCPRELDFSTQQKNNQQKMYQQRAQQVTKQTEDLTKQIQQSIGVQSPNGQMDLTTIDKLIDLLKQ